MTTFLACAFLALGCGCGPLGGGEIIIEEGLNEINMAISGVDTYNPLKTQSKSVREMLTLIYEPLFCFDENLCSVPNLAKELTFSGDKLTARLYLKEGVKWHSGAEFCADDVVYTINEIKNGGTLYGDNVKEITSAAADADGSVIISFSEPVMNVEGLLSFPIIRNGSGAELDEKTDGTGAFYVSEQLVHELVLLPNEAKDTSVSAVKVNVMRSDAACVNAFEMRETDLITSAMVDLGEKTLAGDIQTELYPTNQMTFLGFNCRNEKFIDPSLRIAITNSINRDELVEKAVFAKAVECKLPINPESSAYVLSEGPEFDVDGVMNKAGYVKADGAYKTADGKTAGISILVNIESGEKLKAATLIAEQLTKEGITVTVEEAEYEEYKRRISSGEYDTFIGEVKMRDNLDPSIMTQGENMFKYSDTARSEALLGRKNSYNGEELNEKITDYERAFSLNPPFAPLYYRLEGVVYKKNISGITPPNFYNNLIGIEKLYFKSK